MTRREELRKERERQELKRKEEQELIRKQLEKERAERTINAQTNIVQKQTCDYTSTYTYGTKIYTCTQCGKKVEDGKFNMTQGDTGLCWECHYGLERYAEIKKHRGW